MATIRHKSSIQPRMATLSGFKHPRTQELLDQGLLIWFPGKSTKFAKDIYSSLG
jgi:hypothetical protein